MNNESTLKLTFETNVTKKRADNINALSDALERLDKLELSNLKNLTTGLSALKEISVPAKLGASVVNLVNAVNKISEIENVGQISQTTAEALADGFGKINQASLAFEGNTARIPAGTATIVNAIKELNGASVTLDDNVGVAMQKGFGAIAKAVEVFDAASMKDVQIPKGIGSEIEGLVSAVKLLEDIPDVTSQIDRLDTGFLAIAAAVQNFEGVSARIPVSLGKSVSELITTIKELGEIPDISAQADNLKNGFAIIAEAVTNFEGVSARIPVTLGKGVSGLVTAMNDIQSVQDISAQADNLKNGFAIIAEAVTSFEGVSARIPVTLGRGVSGLVTAINDIKSVQDISAQANNLKNAFAIIAEATSYFNGLDGANYAGIAKLVTALSSVSEVKAINNNVIRNAEKLAQAINILDANVTADTPRLQAMSVIVKQLGLSFNNANRGAKSFGNSLRLINFASFVSLARQAVSVVKKLYEELDTLVSSYGNLQNAVAFMGQSLQDNTGLIGGQVAEWANLGLVDFSDFTNNVAVLNQMLRGYGIAADDAAKMSQNLTQMAYDASYSLGQNGKDLEMWLGRTQSLMAGQARIGYQFGIDTTVKALSENFDGLSNNTDKANKAMAVYETLLANTTAIQGQFGREINTTYVQMSILNNQMSIMQKSIGKALAPMFLGLTKLVMVALKVIAMVIDAVARLFGGEGFKLVDYKDVVDDLVDSVGGTSKSADETEEGFKGATKAAKELKKTISSIDQVFTINDKVNEASSGLSGLSGLTLAGDLSEYEFIDKAAMQAMLDQMDEIDAKAEKIFNTFKQFGGLISPIWDITGIRDIWEALQDMTKNGINFDNVLQMVEGFGALGAVFAIATGKWKIAGALKMIEGVSAIVLAIMDIAKNGASFDGVIDMVDGFGTVLVGISLWNTDIKIGLIALVVFQVGNIIEGIQKLADTDKGNDFEGLLNLISGFSGVLGAILALKGYSRIGGVLMIVSSATEIINTIMKNWEAISTGNFDSISVEDKANIIIAAITGIAGIAIALGKFSKLKFPGTGDEVSETMEEVGAGTGKLTSSLTSLMKNLAIGLVIILEVAAAALLIVGAIILLGKGLEQVGLAWQPVLDNGETIAIAMGVGVAIIALTGAATALLGKAGASLIVELALGIAILAEMGVAVGLFLVEIWAIGLALQEIITVWKPVLDNGEAAVIAIGVGTGLLVGIAAAVALLGVATTATAGLLPLAIGIGTAMLVEMGIATGLFLVEIWAIGMALQEIITAWQPVLDNGDTAVEAIELGTVLLIAIGAVSALLGVAAVASVGLLPLAIAAGTGMLVQLGDSFVSFVESLVKVSNSLTNDLNPALIPLVKILPSLEENMSMFVDGMVLFAGEFVRYAGASTVSGLAATIDTIISWFTADPIQKMIDDTNKQAEQFGQLNSNLDVVIPRLQQGVKGMEEYHGLLEALKTTADKAAAMGDMPSFGSEMGEMSKSLKYAFEVLAGIKTENVANIVNALEQLDLNRFSGIGRNMVVEIEKGLNDYSFNFNTLGNNVEYSLFTVLEGKGRYSGQSVATEITHAINDYSYNLDTATSKIYNNLTFDGYYIGANIAAGIVKGINEYPVEFYSFITSVKKIIAKGFEIKSPSRWGKDFIGYNLGKGIEEGLNESKINVKQFEDSTKNALEGITKVTIFNPIDIPVNATVDTTRINGDMSNVTSRINANVKGEYDYTSEETTNAIYEQTEETVELLTELINAVKNNSFVIDYKGVSRRVTEEQAKDRNVRNVR